MFNHIMVGSNDIERSARFYTAVLGVLGAGEPMRSLAPSGHVRLFYRHDGNTFGVCEPINGEPATSANGATIGFKCASPEQLQQFHDRRFAEIAALIDEWRPVRLVVGLPPALDGTPHAMTARCIRFANQLRGRFNIAVDYADERLSSVEAEERLRDSGHSAKTARDHVDTLAAQIILQSYFQRLSANALGAPHVSSNNASPA